MRRQGLPIECKLTREKSSTVSSPGIVVPLQILLKKNEIEAPVEAQ